MENATKAIIIGASIVITLVIASVGFLLMRSGQDVAKASIGKVTEMSTQVAESDFTMYDQATLSGSEVVNALRKFEKEKHFGILVKTGAITDGKWYINTVNTTAGTITSGGNDIDDTIDETQTEYINPNGVFKGEVARDKNGVIIAITFTQQ